MARKRKPDRRRAAPAGQPSATTTSEVRARRAPGEQAWELVLPRCARDRMDDLEEVAKMIEGGENEIARDELLWLLSGCNRLPAGPQTAGRVGAGRRRRAAGAGAFRLCLRAGVEGAGAGRGQGRRARIAGRPTRPFSRRARGWAFCLRELDKRDLAADVVARLLALDPSDPLGVAGLLAEPTAGAGPCGSDGAAG